MSLFSSSRSLRDRGLPNNRPGFGRVLNRDGSSFPMAGATATASGKYLLRDCAADSRRFLVGVLSPRVSGNRSSIIRCRVAFFLLPPLHISVLGGGHYLNL